MCIRDSLKEVVYAPESLLAKKLMQRLLNEKRSLAIIVDEFGGTAGLVTLEDLVEEIFGDIRDEHEMCIRDRKQILTDVVGTYSIIGGTVHT